MEKIRAMTSRRSSISADARSIDRRALARWTCIALLALADWAPPNALLRENPNLVDLRGRAAPDGEAKRSSRP